MPAEIRVAARYCSIASRYSPVFASSETATRSFCPTSRKLRSASFGDYGATPVIANPATGVTLLLDRAKQQVRAIPTPPGMTPQVTPPRRSGDAEYDSAHPAGHAAKRSGYQDGAGHRGAGQTNHAAPSRRAQAAGATALFLFPTADVLFTLLLGVSVLLHEVAGHPPHRSSRRVLLAMALVDVADFLQHIGPQRGIELQRFLKIGIGVRPIVRRAPERPPEFRHLWDVAYRSLLDCRSECAVV